MYPLVSRRHELDLVSSVVNVCHLGHLACAKSYGDSVTVTTMMRARYTDFRENHEINRSHVCPVGGVIQKVMFL